jgi:hypothetical protein
MKTPGWKIQGTALSLIDEAGDTRLPSADEIYSALVEKRPAADWIPTSVDGLRPSRYPLTPTLTISEGGKNKAPSYSITSTSRGAEVPLDLADLERGHKVAEGVWYPIEPAAGAEILELVRNTGVTLGEAASLKAFQSRTGQLTGRFRRSLSRPRVMMCQPGCRQPFTHTRFPAGAG